jgi:CHAT domain-containing protein/Flp pilus assembly protein TadD
LVLILGLLIYALTNHSRGLTHARSLVDESRYIEAEELLREVRERNPYDLEAHRLYANVSLKRGNLAAARDAFSALAGEDSAGRTNHLLSLALAHYYLGNLDSSSTIVQKLTYSISDSSALARCFHVLGRIHFNKGAYDSAHVYQSRSLRLARQGSDLQTTADALRQLGVLTWYAGKADSARRVFYEPALALYRRLDDNIGEATTLSNIALLDGDIAMHLRAFAIRNEIGDQLGLADSYYFLSPFTGDERLRGLAFSYRQKSLELSTRIGYAWGREVAARALTEMLYQSFDEHTLGVPLHDSAFVTSSEGEIHELLWRAIVHTREKRWQEAASLQERAIHLCDSLPYPSGLGVALGNYAISLMELGRLDQAERAAMRSYAHSRAEIPPGNLLLAEVLMRKRKPQEAFRLLSDAARAFDEQYLTQTSHQDFPFRLGSLTRQRHQLYSKLVSAALLIGNMDSVFHVLERHRSLLYTVGDLAPESNRGEPQEMWFQYKTLLERMDNVSAAECRAMVEEFIGAYNAARKLQPTYAKTIHALRVQRLASLAEVQHSLAPDEVVLEFVVGDNDAFIFVIRMKERRLLRLAATSRELTEAAKTLDETIRRGAYEPRDTLWKSPASFLYDRLIAPVERERLIHEGDHVIILPAGTLHAIPFAALIASHTQHRASRYFIERYELSYHQSATQLVGRTNRRARPTRFLAVVPDRATLRFAEREARSIPSDMSAHRTLLMDDDATCSRVLDEISKHDMIHIAAHGKAMTQAPLHPHIQLADCKLQLAEILDRKLPPVTVILSACETGLAAGMTGDLSRGNVVVSFPIAFLSAGARSVVSPMWLLHDEATFNFMSGFYRHLSQLHSTPRPLVSALARAQREFINEEQTSRYAHPFYWAAFYHIGR